MICVSLGDIELNQALEICRSEDLVEIRADLSGISKQDLDLLLKTPSEKVFTYRKGQTDDKTREEYYRIALKRKLKYIDLDFHEDKELLIKLFNTIKSASSDLILSIHNFEETPPLNDLKKEFKEMKKAGANVVKIATMVNNDEDIVTLLSLYRTPGRKIILGMGQKGMITRVAAIFMGAEFSFASPGEDKKTAPGQLSKSDFDEIMKIMRP